MRGHAQPQNLTAGMPQDQKSIQQPERDRGDHEQIHRRDAVRVISKKRLPSLGWRTPSSRHVLGNGGLPDIDAELEQFAMNPRCTPKRVLNTHVSNELTNLQRSLWSATARSRFPPPTGSESGRCQRITVSGLRIFRASSTPGTRRYSPANTRRSMLLKAALSVDLRCRMLS